MKKIISLVLTLTLLFTQASAIRLYVNDKHLDTEPITVDGHVYAPMPLLVEHLGALVDWDASTQTATIYKDKLGIRIAPYAKAVRIITSESGYTGDIGIDAPAQMYNDCMYLSARSIFRLFSNAKVRWDASTQTVYIATLPEYENFTAPTIPTANPAPKPTYNPTEITVYITPSGIRYHFSPTCGGSNSRKITLTKAKNRGYTPCQKCTSGLPKLPELKIPF